MSIGRGGDNYAAKYSPRIDIASLNEEIDPSSPGAQILYAEEELADLEELFFSPKHFKIFMNAKIDVPTMPGGGHQPSHGSS